MVQRLSVGLVVALMGAALFQAPFSHVHPHGDSDHHAGGFAHAHLTAAHHHAAPDMEVEPAEEEEFAVYLEWTPEAVERVVVHYAEAPIAPVLPVAYVSAGAVEEFVPTSNSPPNWRLLPGRSPPL